MPAASHSKVSKGETLCHVVSFGSQALAWELALTLQRHQVRLAGVAKRGVPTQECRSEKNQLSYFLYILLV